MDELTKSSDVIPAKHIFFIMDACYGGLAISRNAPGTERFLKDMLRRRACQVLTAGKADEVVTDGNGVRPGHSLFTAYLLEGLEGGAAREEGIITANGLMGYVYEKVSNDQHSNQTPHFTTLEGDGDFVFNMPHEIEKSDKTPQPEAASKEAKKESGEPGEVDVLVSTPFIETEELKKEGIATTLESILEQEKKCYRTREIYFSLSAKVYKKC
jgi:uncharacterized caspase-like protein